MTDWLTELRWSPYVVGAGIGILSWFTWLISGKPIGCSTTFSRAAGAIERLVRGERVLNRPYYREVAPAVDWQAMLVVGIVIGAAASALLSGDLVARWIPHQWEGAFGSGIGLRAFVALLGGILLGFGARWADGCTSGHGISGTMQLSVASWVSAIGFFAGGIGVAQLLFRVLA
ncbi:MAG: YeeE/YedE thiosulfate transporter family protein [Candidatus Bipolaricaulota bacterium]|nr:YeeE/YedE family protein [Candidatus Bipolaricaulota bacterium]